MTLSNLKLLAVVTHVPAHADLGEQRIVEPYWEAQVSSGMPTWWDGGKLAAAGATRSEAVRGLCAALRLRGLSGNLRVIYPPRGLGIGRVA
jgi:hypothetical protein